MKPIGACGRWLNGKAGLSEIMIEHFCAVAIDYQNGVLSGEDKIIAELTGKPARHRCGDPASGFCRPLGSCARLVNGCKRLLLRRVGVMDEAVRSATIIAAARLVMLMSGVFMALIPMSA
jgi:hypothetical protein